MELADFADRLLVLAREQADGREWLLPRGVPAASLSWEKRQHPIAEYRQAALRLPILTYTDNGYGHDENVHVPFSVGPEGICEEEAVSAAIAKRLAGVIRRHEKLGHAPARYDEFDPDIAHLFIDPIFGRHLDERYGADAPRIARRLVGRLLRREQRMLSKSLPKGSEIIDEKASVSSFVISGNVHLGSDIFWKSRTLVIPDVVLAETVTSAVRGQPVSHVVKHDMLGDAPITEVTSVVRTRDPGGGTTTIRVDIPVVPVSEFWAGTN